MGKSVKQINRHMNINLVAERTFNLLKGFGYEVSCFNKQGDLVIDPMEATRFAVESPNILVRIDPTDKYLSLKTGTPGESIEKLRPMLKELAQKSMLDFDYSVFDKQIKPKGEKVDVARHQKEEIHMSEDMNELRKLAGLGEETVDASINYNEGKTIKTSVGEFPANDDGSPLSLQDFDQWTRQTERGTVPKSNIISQRYQMYLNDFKAYAMETIQVKEASLGKMTGSRKSSYQPLTDSVKIIVRHNKEVNEEVRGARSRNIHSILIQRGEEKFKMAENNLTAARAMARHLHNGGETFDAIGESITEMSREYKKLKEFVRYVNNAKLVNETNQEFVTLAMENIDNFKSTFKKTY